MEPEGRSQRHHHPDSGLAVFRNYPGSKGMIEPKEAYTIWQKLTAAFIIADLAIGAVILAKIAAKKKDQPTSKGR
jgi:hypothetical protein